MARSPHTDPIADLFEEYAAWYEALAADGHLPRTLSGVSGAGRQFIIMLDDLELLPMARNKYIRYLLEENGAVLYAYGGIALRGDSDLGVPQEELDVVAASSSDFMAGSWKVVRAPDGSVEELLHLGTRSGSDPQEHPGCWFLCGDVRFSEIERERFAALWEAAREGVVFSDRGDEE